MCVYKFYRFMGTRINKYSNFRLFRRKRNDLKADDFEIRFETYVKTEADYRKRV